MARGGSWKIPVLVVLVGLPLAALVLLLCGGDRGRPAALVEGAGGAATATRALTEAATVSESRRLTAPAAPRMARIGSLMGRVLDDEGVPVPAAAITVESVRPAASQFGENGLPPWRVFADASGAFFLNGLDAGRYDVTAEADGFGASGQHGVLIDEGGTGRADLVLMPARTHVGRVVDVAELPVAGAEVLVSYRAGPSGWRTGWVVRRTSDASGWFTFPLSGDLRVPVADLQARRDGVGEASERLWLPGALDKVVTLKLKTGTRTQHDLLSPLKAQGFGMVAGAVVDAAGAPVAGVTVGPAWTTPSGVGWAMKLVEDNLAATDAGGRFRVERVGASKACRIGARRARGPITWSPVFELPVGGEVTNITIILGAVPDLVVHVVGADGLPVEGAAVMVDEDAGDEPGHYVVRADAKGDATFPAVGSEWVLVGADRSTLPQGSRVDEAFQGPRQLLGERREPLVMRLRQESVIRGTIVVEDGSPLTGGTVGFGPLPQSTGQGVKMGPNGLMEGRAAAAPKATRYARLGPAGEFTLRLASIDDYEVVEVMRSGALELFAPVRRVALRPDAENKIAVRRLPGR